MQCGPIRHAASLPSNAPNDLEVRVRECPSTIAQSPDAGIQEVFSYIANDENRTADLVEEILGAYEKGRKVLVLTERMDHLKKILVALESQLPSVCVLHGRMSTRQRAAMLSELKALPPDADRVLLATGKLVGEGFDHPHLDTLILAMPISWKRTLQQYAGRVHREHNEKENVWIIDFVDTDHPALMRMWERRRRGYRAMGYRIAATEVSNHDMGPHFC